MCACQACCACSWRLPALRGKHEALWLVWCRRFHKVCSLELALLVQVPDKLLLPASDVQLLHVKRLGKQFTFGRQECSHELFLRMTEAIEAVQVGVQ